MSHIDTAREGWAKMAGLWARMNRHPLRPTLDRAFLEGYEGLRPDVLARPVITVGAGR